VPARQLARDDTEDVAMDEARALFRLGLFRLRTSDEIDR